MPDEYCCNTGCQAILSRVAKPLLGLVASLAAISTTSPRMFDMEVAALAECWQTA